MSVSVSGIALSRTVASVRSQLVSTWQSQPLGGRASGCEVLPLSQNSRASGLVGLAIDEVAFGLEMIVEGSVD